MNISKSALALAGAVILIAGAASAQDAPQTIPGVGNFSLPSSTPTPRPTPTPGPPSIPNAVPLPTLTPVAPVPPSAAPIATPTATPRPRIVPPTLPAPRATTPARPASPSPTPTPSPTPDAAVPLVTATPPPAVTPEISPSPAPAPSPVATATATQPAGQWPVVWIALLIALAVVGVGFVLWRRRPSAEPIDWTDTAEEGTAPLTPPRPVVPAAPTPAPAAPRFLDRGGAPAAASEPAVRPWIDLSIMPRRAGLNLVTATADIGLVVRNTGDMPARNVRIDVRLLSAKAGQEDELGALFAAPIGRPVTPAFDLAPGAEKTMRALATLLRDDISVLTAAGRPMFVPIVAVNILYDRGDGGTGQTAAAFAIGIERPGADKLGPFWLDQPNAMHEALGQRPHALSLRR